MTVAESAADRPAASPDASDPSGSAGAKRLGVFQQLLRFVVIGGGCALIDAGTYALLLGGFGWPSAVSKTISFILGTGTSYFVNRKLTFSGASTGNAGAKAGAFAVLYTATFFVNLGTNELLIYLFSAHLAWQFSLFWVIAQGTGTLINFVMLKLLIFRDK